MPYAGRSVLPRLPFDRRPQASAPAFALDLLQVPPANTPVGQRSGIPPLERSSLPYTIEGSPTRAAGDESGSSLLLDDAFDAAFLHSRAHVPSDLPRSVSSDRTPVGSPGRTAPPELEEATAALSLIEGTVPTAPRPRLGSTGRNHSTPLLSHRPAQQAAPQPPASPTFRLPRQVDVIKRDLKSGGAVLEEMRQHDWQDYQTNDAQQYIDSHELQKLTATLRSWGKDIGVQSYRPQAHTFAPVQHGLEDERTTDLAVQTRNRLAALRLAMLRSGQGPIDARSTSPQAEFRDVATPSLSRNSSNSSRQGSLFRLLPTRQRSSEQVSTRSSASSDSLFSRESMSSYSSAASSAASASFAEWTDAIFTPKMILPLIVDLQAILGDEWTLEQCTANLPSMLLRLEVLETWLYDLRLSRKRASISVAPIGQAPWIDLRHKFSIR